jgi:hypothetical protein
MRRLVIALAFVLVPSLASAQAVTTRIETRPYYGAIVTQEQGVRVWRAQPAHDRIIINPNGRANITLNVGGDTRAAPVVMHNSTTVVTPPRRLLRYAD